MRIKKKRSPQMWLVMVIAVIFWIVGAGFYHNLSAKDEETYKGLKLFSDVIEIIDENYVDPVDKKELMEKAVQGMVHSLDPHSSLLLPEELEELHIDTKGEFTGIGVSITIRNGFVTVISPIEGTPAYKARIKAGDIIVKVDGERTKGLRDAVKKIRGPKGTPVVVTIIRKGSSEPIDFKLIRDLIPVESVQAIVLKPGYGYVWITHFRDNTTIDLKKALGELEAGDIPLKGLVLDLRDNPGGLLPQAIEVSDTFLEKGKILSIKGRLKRHTRNYNAHADKIKRSYPIVTLINGGSASASEIVAGALQDNKRALILGTTSFGKGSVQTVETLRDGYGLKLTIARYYTPSGRSIQAKGIEPDIVVKRSFIDQEDTDKGDDNLLKEKDLINHLEAESPESKGKEIKLNLDKKSKRKMKPQTPLLKHGPLDLARLMSDNQIRRALEILIGYDILNGN